MPQKGFSEEVTRANKTVRFLKKKLQISGFSLDFKANHSQIDYGYKLFNYDNYDYSTGDEEIMKLMKVILLIFFQVFDLIIRMIIVQHTAT